MIIMWNHFLWSKFTSSIFLLWSLIFQKLWKFILFFMLICFNSLLMIFYSINMLSSENLLLLLMINVLDMSTAFLISNMIIVVNLISWNILWTEKIIDSHENFLIVSLKNSENSKWISYCISKSVWISHSVICHFFLLL